MRDARWVKHRISVERWKLANYQFYLEQKRRLAHRPEYLAHRRAMHAQKKAARSNLHFESLSTLEIINDIEKTDEKRNRSSDRSWSGATGSTQRTGDRPALRAPTQGPGESGWDPDASWAPLL